jgi:hypothetical protein
MMVTEKEYRHTRWADEAALREGFAGSALDQKKSHWIKLLTEAGNNEKSQEVKEYVRRELERVWDEYALLPVRCRHLLSSCQVEQLHILKKMDTWCNMYCVLSAWLLFVFDASLL